MYLDLFWEKMITMCSGPKMKKVNSYKQQVQKQGFTTHHVMAWGCISVLGKAYSHSYDSSINAVRYTEILVQYMLHWEYIFHGMSMHFSTRQCKSTLCTHCKGMAGEDGEKDSVLAFLLSWLQIILKRHMQSHNTTSLSSVPEVS